VTRVTCVVAHEAADRAGRERLLRNCARPPFALGRQRGLDPERLLYESTKRGSGGVGPLLLTPLELLDRVTALVPPPPLLRVNGRLLDISATIRTGRCWPTPAESVSNEPTFPRAFGIGTTDSLLSTDFGRPRATTI
jgi:hypothetical protein